MSRSSCGKGKRLQGFWSLEMQETMPRREASSGRVLQLGVSCSALFFSRQKLRLWSRTQTYRGCMALCMGVRFRTDGSIWPWASVGPCLALPLFSRVGYDDQCKSKHSYLWRVSTLHSFWDLFRKRQCFPRSIMSIDDFWHPQLLLRDVERQSELRSRVQPLFRPV